MIHTPHRSGRPRVPRHAVPGGAIPERDAGSGARTFAPTTTTTLGETEMTTHRFKAYLHSATATAKGGRIVLVASKEIAGRISELAGSDVFVNLDGAQLEITDAACDGQLEVSDAYTPAPQTAADAEPLLWPAEVDIMVARFRDTGAAQSADGKIKLYREDGSGLPVLEWAEGMPRPSVDALVASFREAGVDL